MKYKLVHSEYGDGFPDEVYTVKEIADGDILFRGSPYKDFADNIGFFAVEDLPPLTTGQTKGVE